MKYPILLLILSMSSMAYSQTIFEAIDQKDHQQLETLLQSGESTSQQNKNGMTPLYMAVLRNDTTAVRMLIEAGAAVNGKSKNGLTPIVIGAAADVVESVRILLENGADVHFRSETVGNQQPIRLASREGSLDILNS